MQFIATTTTTTTAVRKEAMKNGMKALGFVVAGLSAVLFAQSTLAAYDRHTDP